MSPMATAAAKEDGMATQWHMLHYGAVALGQAGLIMLESTAVSKDGRSVLTNLGIWNDDQTEALHKLVHTLHEQNAKVGIQLWHAGRKREVEGVSIAPTPIPYQNRTPQEMTEEDIQTVILEFKEAALRAKQADFDVIEIHAAHGFLINQFLSPYLNKRTDKYGGTQEKRYQFLREIIHETRQVWDGPLFVRISADEYSDEGNNISDYVYYTSLMKEQDVDLIDCSSGGVLSVKPPQIYPGYQVPFAEKIRHEVGISTAAVGLISSGLQAEEILQNSRADLIAIGRAFLRDPFWTQTAARQLGEQIAAPFPYSAHWFV